MIKKLTQKFFNNIFKFSYDILAMTYNFTDNEKFIIENVIKSIKES